MAGVAKNINPSKIQQGPGDLWLLTTAPTDAAPRLDLAADGTPDSGTHGVCTHLGAMADCTTSIKPEIKTIDLDTLDAPIGGIVGKLEGTIEATMYQVEMQKLARAIGICSYSTGAGYKMLTFGGITALNEVCVAAVSPTRASATKFIASVLYKALAAGSVAMQLGRSAAANYKLKFIGLADLTRAVGQQGGIIQENITAPAAGVASARDFQASEISQGPADLWILSPAPTDAAVRPTLDAATLTPDSAIHAQAMHCGGTEGAVTVTLEPQIELGYFDQADMAVCATVTALKASIEAELSQTQMSILARVLGGGVGTFSSDGDFEQVTFGGGTYPTPICVAAVQKKLADPTKVIGACLYRVFPEGGISITHSRKKRNSYKVNFAATLDLARTAGKRMGVVWETI